MDAPRRHTAGPEAPRRIRALGGGAARIPVIGVSGRSSGDEAARAQAAGMSGFVTKPISPNALNGYLATIAAGGVYLFVLPPPVPGPHDLRRPRKRRGRARQSARGPTPVCLRLYSPMTALSCFSQPP